MNALAKNALVNEPSNEALKDGLRAAAQVVVNHRLDEACVDGSDIQALDRALHPENYPAPNDPPVGPRIGQTKCSRCKGRGYVETYNGDVHCPECNPSVDSLRTEGR